MTQSVAPSREAALISVADAAKALCISTRFLRLLGSRGQVRIVRLGRRTLIPRDEIQRLAAATDTAK
jgi:excisionase family DNA binding protein